MGLEESEYFDVFDEKDEKELLFRIFKHIVIGGTFS